MKSLGVQPPLARKGTKKRMSVIFDEMASSDVGSVFAFTKGEDFETEPKAYAPGIYIAMNRRGVKVRVSVREDEIHAQIVGARETRYTVHTEEKLKAD